ncbi:methyltransferase, putative [Bodo saltans]|uniref:tRNA N(3)-methylcytidine methyltransferase n=1 Tax=Bodo saltans TaxID=75058 RepID=A0A0S4KFU5_BODSA|nr:methyltransferase, putative [Bodo saltans]|eukprot:CUI11167.1 methyltransferase, putative [Bodo saltans]
MEPLCPHCHQPMPEKQKRPRDDAPTQHEPTTSSTDTSSSATTRPTSATRQLLPPFVEHYAPYTGRQLTSVASRQVQACAEQWDRYYRQNTINGYKDRHYLLREFSELQLALELLRSTRTTEKDVVHDAPTTATATVSRHHQNEAVTLVEIGCGVGNAMIPIIDEFSDVPVSDFTAYGFDISKVAVDLLQEKIRLSPSTLGGGRLTAIPHDLADYELPFSQAFIREPIRFGTIIFVLCSVPVPKQQIFVDRVARLIAPGGFVFVRDYCIGDLAQARFAEGKRFAPPSASSSLSTREPSGDEEGTPAAPSTQASSSTYLRSNGTLSHFFSVESLTRLFLNTGRFRVVQAVEVDRVAENRRAGAVMNRKFVQARFERLKD